jgi:hypothetical protein
VLIFSDESRFRTPRRVLVEKFVINYRCLLIRTQLKAHLLYILQKMWSASGRHRHHTETGAVVNLWYVSFQTSYVSGQTRLYLYSLFAHCSSEKNCNWIVFRNPNTSSYVINTAAAFTTRHHRREDDIASCVGFTAVVRTSLPAVKRQ